MLYLDVISWCCVGSLCYCAVVLDHYVVELYHDVISWCSIRSLSCCYMSWCYFIMLCCGSLPVDVISSYADIVSQCYIRLLGVPVVWSPYYRSILWTIYIRSRHFPDGISTKMSVCPQKLQISHRSWPEFVQETSLRPRSRVLGEQWDVWLGSRFNWLIMKFTSGYHGH